jgi:uncharacterized sulfatase
MKHYFSPLNFLLCVTASVSAFFMLPAQAATAQPNILLIYSDDHGWADMSLKGSDPDVRTPNIDQLAR